MLKSILIAGALMVTSNFMPTSSVTVPTIIASTLPAATPVLTTAVAVARPVASRTDTVNAYVPSNQAADGLMPEEREFIGRVNAERTSRGLNALSLDPLLVKVARGHSREMCELDYFDHHSPSPGICTPMDRYLTGLHGSGQGTPGYLLVGENIYYCSESNATYNVEYGHQALMNSPGHRANILEPRFAKIGVGVFRNARGEFWVTEMFMKDR